jgi:TRAP-type transport system small permease protein
MRIVRRLLEACVILSVSAMVIVLAVNVFLRYVVHRPFAWGEEISVLMVVWLVFTGAGLVHEKDEHVAISYLFDLFPARWRKATLLFGNLCVSAVLLIHLVSGLHLIRIQMKSSMISVDLPMGLFSAAVLLGVGTMFLYTIGLIVKQLKSVA